MRRCIMLNKLNHEGSEQQEVRHTGIRERRKYDSRTSSTMKGANWTFSIHSPDHVPVQEYDRLLRTSEACPGCAKQDLEKKRGKKSSSAVPPGQWSSYEPPELREEKACTPFTLVMRKREVDCRYDASEEQEPEKEASNRIFSCPHDGISKGSSVIPCS